jgi:hypothetical protein
MIIDHINVNGYVFVQAMKKILHGSSYELQPIFDRYAIPGGKISDSKSIYQWAKEQKNGN